MNASLKEKDEILVVIPVFNEAGVIYDVINEIQTAGFENIIVVDDGSLDNTYAQAKQGDVVVLQHAINRGKGAAIKTGIEAAKIMGADTVITMDGDGQHNPQDILKMLESINQKYDVVLGTRPKKPAFMPIYKIAANYIGNFFTWLTYGLWVADSQSGFRAFSKKAFHLIDTKTDRYEYDSEVIKEIHHHKLKYIQIPIEVRYTKYSMTKQNRQNIKNGLRTLIKMMTS